MTDLFEPLPESAATRRKENTRTRLVRASLDVFVEKGIDGATVDDLVTAAGFTRGAFYSNFSTKEEVFDELFASVTEELLAIMGRELIEAMPAGGEAPADDATVMVTIFEAIRPSDASGTCCTPMRSPARCATSSCGIGSPCTANVCATRSASCCWQAWRSRGSGPCCPSRTWPSCWWACSWTSCCASRWTAATSRTSRPPPSWAPCGHSWCRRATPGLCNLPR